MAILVPEFPSQTHVFFWREITALRKMGVEVRLISTRRPSGVPCGHAFASEAAQETHYVFPPSVAVAVTLAQRPARLLEALAYIFKLKDAGWPRRAGYLAMLACAADLLAYCWRNDIQHVHGHSCADAAHILSLCHILGGPTYSLTLHGDLPVYGQDHDSKMAQAACITCAGPHLKQQIEEQVGVPGEQVLSNGMGVDTDRFQDLGLRRYEPGRLHLVTVGRLALCKGHRFAMAGLRLALDQGCTVHYSIAGEGPDRAEIEAEIRQLQLEEHVTLLGTQSEEQVFDLLQRSDAFVLPSVGLGEAWPVAVMEAMSCGLPVICSRIGATPWMITNGVDGLLVEQSDAKGLGNAFVRLAQNVETRRRLGACARRRAEREFDSWSSARRFLDFVSSHTECLWAKEAPDVCMDSTTSESALKRPLERIATAQPDF